MTSRTLVLAVGVFAIAVALRLGFLAEARSLPSFRVPTPGMDEAVAWNAARQLRRGAEPNIERMTCSAPAYPYWLALTQGVLGESITTHRIVNGALGSLRLVLVFLIVQRLTRRRWAAAGATVILAALPSLIYFDVSLSKAGLDVTLMTLLIGVVVVASPAAGRRLAVLGAVAGLLLSVAFLSQLNTFLTVAAVGGFTLLHPSWSRRDKAAFLAPACGVLAVVVAVMVHAHFSATPRSPFQPRAGVDVYIGFSGEATGHYAAIHGVPGFPYGHTFTSRLRAEREVGRPLSPQQSSSHYLDEALAEIGERPLRALRLAALKLRLFFNDAEIKGNHYIPALAGHSRVLRYSPSSFGWLVILGILGAFELWRRGQRHILALLGGIVLAIAIANVMTFVTFRFRIPAAVPLAVLSGFGLLACHRAFVLVRERFASGIRCALGAAAPIALPALVASVVAFWPAVSDGDHRAFMRKAEANEEASRSARDDLRALAQLQGESGAEGVRARAILLSRLHRYTESFALLRRSASGSLGAHAVNRAYLRYLVWLGDYEEARRLLDDVRRHDPGALRRLLVSSRPAIRKVVAVHALDEPLPADARGRR